MASRICRVFSFDDLLLHVEQVLPELAKRKTGPRETNLALHEKVFATLKQAQAHATAFHRQIKSLAVNFDDALLSERKTAAAKYFSTQVLLPLIASIDEHITSLGTLTKVAKQVRLWKEVNLVLKQKSSEISGFASYNV